MSILTVIDLFAGVGGFRLGLEGWNGLSSTSKYTKEIEPKFKVVWSNQWEPSTKKQYASETYINRFGDNNHSNEDIATVRTSDIPNHDVLVGGFPCQDYSVAKSLGQSKGIVGKKGVLWWEIHRILKEKGEDSPRYLILENVDRLLISPASQRGRDFAIILASLSDLGYDVEWRVINAADYGMPQRRKRTYIVAYKKNSPVQCQITSPFECVILNGVLETAFPAEFHTNLNTFSIDGDLADITGTFNMQTPEKTIFKHCGFVRDRTVVTTDYVSKFTGNLIVLGDVLQDISEIPDEYFISDVDLPKWKYLKGYKREERIKPNGEKYYYSEGAMSFPDSINKPSRTIITAEGGTTPSRFKHVIEQDGKLRRLTPLELERLNMFPDHHTSGNTPTKRAFFMGNAFVVGVIENIGNKLHEFHMKGEKL